MSWRAAAVWVAAFALLVLIATYAIDTPGDSRRGGSETSADAHEKGPQSAAVRTAKVLRVVDGDTIVVRDRSGSTERVRYIGVDTPESVKPNTPVQCFAHEASSFNRRLVQGRTVRLVPDREPQDRFGRSLAFVYVGDTFVNAQLLRRGFARTIEIAPNTSKAEYFARLERVAIRTNTGLWQACRR